MSETKTEAPYGTWRSPITTDLIVAGTVGLMDVMLTDSATYWVEMRPEEQGRYVIVCVDDDGDSPRDINPASFNARTRVHEYGGAPFAMDGDIVCYSNYSDQRIYRQAIGGKPSALTSAGDYRYADAIIDHERRRLICVCEDHTGKGTEAVNTLVGIPVSGAQAGEVSVLVSGEDFYASPSLDPNGDRLAWVSWSHPDMPWDASRLWAANLDVNGEPHDLVHVAGGPDESVMQPQWAPDGTLYFLSDRTGWWNLYCWSDGGIRCVFEMAAEFGAPHWVFGDRRYGIESADRIVCTFKQGGVSHLATLNPTSRQLSEIETPFTSISYLQARRGRVVFLAASPTKFPCIVSLDLETQGIKVLRSCSDQRIDPGYVSVPEPIEFPTGGGLTAHGFFYAPKNRLFRGSAGARPPLLVIGHGGPTGSCENVLKLAIQYWTSRGVAVLDVNYGGSSGYGRAYRNRLNGRWGVVDVEDCVNGARSLVERGLVDGDRLAVRGSSAGGYTTLCALTFSDIFKAGASYYGVSDLEALAAHTHKFESRYLDRLVGPYPAQVDLYHQRSPINCVERLSCPVIFFQGLEDRIVPPDQAEKMVEALRTKGLPVAYMAFEGEQHGFRRAETIKRTLEAELYFYARVLGFDLAEPVEPVVIQNL